MLKNKKVIIVIVLVILIAIIAAIVIASQNNKKQNNNNNSNFESDVFKQYIDIPMSFRNKYSKTITKLYMSVQGTNEWGEDLLKGQNIEPDRIVSLTLNINQDNYKYDIKVETEGGEKITFEKVNLNRVSTVKGGTVTLLKDSIDRPQAIVE
jgi:uncharacterized membrane protein